MKQYNPGRQLIGIVLLVGALWAGLVLNAPAEPSLAALQTATTEQFLNQARPPVRPLHLQVHDNMATASVELEPWLDKPLVEFVLTVPPAVITSATITQTGIDPETTATSVWPVTMTPMGYVRGNRLVRFQFSASMLGKEHPRRGMLTLRFAGTARASQGSSLQPGPIEAMLRELVANPDDIPRMAIPPSSAPMPAPDGAPPLGNGTIGAAALFEITNEGFVEFSGSDLTSAGVSIQNVPRQNVSIWTDGEAQPIWAIPTDGGLDSSIEPGDRFIVFARDNMSTYTGTRRYWVRTDVQAKPMSRRTLTTQPSDQTGEPWFMAQEVIEKDIPPVLTKNDQFLSILEHRWVWWTWTTRADDSNLPQPHNYSEAGVVEFDLQELVQTNSQASIALNFFTHSWATDSPPVPFEVLLNGTPLGEAVVDSADGLHRAMDIEPGVLKATANRLEIWPVVTTTTATMPDICFDRLEINYPRSFRVTSPTLEFSAPAEDTAILAITLPPGGFVADVSGAEPAILAVQQDTAEGLVNVPAPRENERFIAVKTEGIAPAALQPYTRADDLYDSSNTADLVIISWPGFIDLLEPWVRAKEEDGYATRVVDVFDIYDQFGSGHQSPHAIRAFLRHAATHWRSGNHGPAVSSIMLVGDSTSAYRNEFRNDVINYVPTMRLAGTSDLFASDQWYACLFGDDPYADAVIGRFSVNSAEDLRHTLKKQLDYRAQQTPAPWQNTIGFVADHTEFEDAVNRSMTQAVPPRFFMKRVMMSELPWVDNFYFPKDIADAQQAKVSTEATGQIRDMFNDGAAVVTYFGHGSPNVWSSERMWFGGDSHNSDNLLLTNRDRLSIVINMTCNSGAIDYPQPRWNVCISEDFMRVENGGAVACFVPSGPGLTVQHERLMMEIGPALFSGKVRPLGESLQLALWRYLADQNQAELAQMYILLGDPLLIPQIATATTPGADAVRTGDLTSSELIMLPPPPSPDSPRHVQTKTYTTGVEPANLREMPPGGRLLNLNDAKPADTETAVVAVADAGTTLSTSFFVPVDALSSVQVTRWRRLDDVTVNDGRAEIEFNLSNDAPFPVGNLQLSVTNADCPTCPPSASEPLTLPAMSNGRVTLEIELRPGLNVYHLVLSSAGAQAPVSLEPTLVLPGMRDDGSEGTSLPPALIDPQSLNVRYRENEDSTRATISFQVHVLDREGLANLAVSVARPDGTIMPDATVAVPDARPGSSTILSTSVDLPAGTTSSTYTLRFDPSGLFPEFRNYPPQPIALGSEHYPDVAITAITSPDPSPADGQTIFFDVEVSNLGTAATEGVQVVGHRVLENGETEPLQSQVRSRREMVSLNPGTSQSVRLRWDPFQNAGENRVRFEAVSAYQVADKNPANNSVEFVVPVRTKARLQKGKIEVLPFTEEERQQRRIRISAQIHNAGESPAHGLQVKVYGSPEMNESDLLGTTDIEIIRPGETHTAVVTYQMKPGEENRRFRIHYELLYKGARQRVPMETMDEMDE